MKRYPVQINLTVKQARELLRVANHVNNTKELSKALFKNETALVLFLNARLTLERAIYAVEQEKNETKVGNGRKDNQAND